MSDPAPAIVPAAPPSRPGWTARLPHPARQPWWLTLGVVAALLAVVALGATVVTFLAPPQTSIELMPREQLDGRWGTYLSEREWGTPREAVNGNGWAVLWTNAITTNYRFGEDGIAGFSDNNGEFNLGWAFWDGTDGHVTERFNGRGNPQGQAGEQITDDRIYHESDPQHAYQRLTYEYPINSRWFTIELEAARYDSSSFTMVATVTNTTTEARSVEVVFKAWLSPGGTITSIADGLVLTGRSSSVAVVGDAPSEWQISADKGALDTNLRATGLTGDMGGNIGALAYQLEIPAGSSKVIHIGVAEATAPAGARAAANSGTPDPVATLAAAQAVTVHGQSTGVISARRNENAQLFAGEVSQHEPLYRQSLMSMLWNESYYRWDGSGTTNAYAGLIDAHDVLIMPDKWEYPWPASWDGAFQAVTATLIDASLAEDQLRFFLSERWQQADGHIPCAEWVMDSECPPIFAWAAWRVYEVNHDTQFLTDVYPALQRNYDYWWNHLRVGDALFSAGFLGMDNLPRPLGVTAQADASAWMAFFARDMARIASELHDSETSQRYWLDRGSIQEAINSTLWDESSGFYYDAGRDGKLALHKSYTGLVPLIAGVVPPERLPSILSALSDQNQFLGPAGIRSMSASDPLYLPATGGHGVNSNWRGPVWLPLNYLLVEALSEVDPGLATDIRNNVVNAVEADWTSTGRLHEFFDGNTGAGLGADNQAGWTALVANLIAEGWPASAP